MNLPHGFRPLESRSPFVNHVGPFFVKEEADGVVFGLFVEEKHCNSSGSVHGGLVATVADLVLGNNIGVARTPKEVLAKYRSDGIAPGKDELPKIVTVNLTLDYLGRAVVGDWLEFRADVHKAGGTLSFASAQMTSDQGKVSRVSGVYRSIG